MNGPDRVGIPSTDAAGSACSRPPSLDEREARRLGRDQPIAESELLAERDAFGLLNQQGVGSGIDDEAVELLAEHDAARARPAFEQHERDTP